MEKLAELVVQRLISEYPHKLMRVGSRDAQREFESEKACALAEKKLDPLLAKYGDNLEISGGEMEEFEEDEMEDD